MREDQAPDDPLLAPRRFAMVDMLAVRGDRRRRGIGRALMEATHRWAEGCGLEEVALNVWEFNQRAIAFYEHLGYETLSRQMVRRGR
jgi:ribosomal protein S18 acetylase RimI-like enzyme